MEDKMVMVAGAGISGINACRLLLKAGREVVLYDGNDKLDALELREKVGEGELTVLLGALKPEDIEDVELCVISPGISQEAPFVQTVRAAGIPVWSEVELASRYAKGRLIAITGTNGKTTTTALTGQICRDAGEETFVVGNIGRAYTMDALETTEKSVTVAEISSFQLETIDEFHPTVSAVLNITPDHLDRHKTMECYSQVKMSIAKNQTADEVCVLNYEDAYLREHSSELTPKVRFFSSARKLDEGAYLDGENIMMRKDGGEITVCNIHELNLLGRHNYENVMAAVLMADSIGIPMDSIRKTLRAFTAVEHRIEYVREVNGVTYYNDSKGTNPDAAIQAIRAMVRPTVLIGGGYDKGGEFDEWIEACLEPTEGFPRGHMKHLVLMGVTAQKISDTAKRYGFDDITFVDSMEEAIKVCAAQAQPGDAVLLSPACASWGMFKNYEQRGEIFKELVRAL